MVVRESYSQLPHCPVLTQWRPSVATQHSVQMFSEGSEKSEWQILHSEIQKKNRLSESSLSFQHTHLSRVAPILEQPPWRAVKQICCVGERREAWESQVPHWGHAGSYHRLRVNPCPLHRALCHALPGLPWHRPGPNQALAYPPHCRYLWVLLLNTSKRCLSQKRVYTFSI